MSELPRNTLRVAKFCPAVKGKKAAAGLVLESNDVHLVFRIHLEASVRVAALLNHICFTAIFTLKRI